MNHTERAKKERLKRLYNRIYNLISNNENRCLFITFTFTDGILKTTNKKTRERYIKAYLNKETSEYILNRDYGKTTDREHYHAIAKPKAENGLICYSAYKYGQIRAEKINHLQRFTKNKQTLKEIANNLMIHATKSSTKGARIIYSRELKNKFYDIE